MLNWRDLSHPRAGGAERYVHEIGRRWADRGHEVTLFCARPSGMSAFDERDGVRIVRAGSRFGVYREAKSYLCRTAGCWDAVVESVNTRPFFAHRHAEGARTVAIFYQLARDVWFHEAPLPIALAGRYVLEPRWLRLYRGARVVTISPSSAHDLRRVGIDVSGITPPGTPFAPVSLPAKDRHPSLLFVGRLTASKRPEDAVQAWRLVRREVPTATLSVIGDGPLRDLLERSAVSGMTVHGKVDEASKWALLSRANLLLVPSVREGWGIVVMEAATAGTPAVAYRVPGLVDSVRDTETGWLCDPSPDAMAATILRALRDPQRGPVAERARTWARRFTWEDTADGILEHISTPQVSYR